MGILSSKFPKNYSCVTFFETAVKIWLVELCRKRIILTSNFKLNIVKFELYKFISSIIEIFIGVNMNKQNCNILENFELQTIFKI